MLFGLQDAILDLAKRAPLFINVEDLHWADSKSIEVLRSLLGTIWNGPVLMMLTTRPGGVQADAVAELQEAVAEGGGVTMELPRLSSEEISVMMEGMISGKCDQASFQEVAAECQGNPLQAVSAMHALVNANMLESKDGRWRISTSKEGIPNDVRSAVVAGLSCLDEDGRQLLEAAAVFSDFFEPPTLARIMGRPETDVQRACHDLCRSSWMLIAKGDGYLFSHQLYQEATYAGIADQKRRELHRRVGQVLETIANGPEVNAQLSWHYLLAGQQAECLDYSLKAGTYCLRSASLPEALQYYERSLGLARANPEKTREKADALEGIITVHKEMSNYESTLPFFDELLKMPLPPEMRARVLVKYAEVWNPTKLGNESRATMDHLLSEAESIDGIADLDLGEAWNQRAQVAFWHCDWGASEIAYQRSEECFRRAGAKERLATQMAYHVVVQLSLGKVKEALAEARGAKDLLGECPNPSAEMEVEHYLGIALAHIGEMEEAGRHLSRSLELAKRLGDALYVTWGHYHLGLSMELSGDLESAWHEAKGAMASAEATESTYLIISALGLLTHLEFIMDQEGAETKAMRLADLTVAFKWRMRTPTRGMALVVAAQLNAHRYQWGEMEANYQNALDCFSGATLAQIFLPLTHLWFARDLMKSGQRQKALREYALAAEEFGNLSNQYMEKMVADEVSSFMT
jgi:tetratricopeptide (TPR) repeat protein